VRAEREKRESPRRARFGDPLLDGAVRVAEGLETGIERVRGLVSGRSGVAPVDADTEACERLVQEEGDTAQLGRSELE
jgi:hypothetical protein